MAKPKPSRVAAALQYLQQMRDRAADFGGGVVDTLGDRAQDVGGLAYEAFTSDPNIGRMTTAEFSQAAADRPSTPRLDATAQGIGAMGKALVTQPVQTAKAVVVDPVVEAFESPRAMGQFAGEFVNPLRIAAALRKTAPIAELDVYHGTPHQFPGTEENPLGEFDASKIGTGEGAQAYGHGIYLAESPDVGNQYQQFLASRKNDLLDPGNLAASMMYRTPEGTKKAGLREIDAALNGIKHYPNSYADAALEKTALEKARELLESGAELPKQGGSLYKADLPDDMIDRMLDYDKPLSEQPEIVKALRKTGYLKEAMQKGGFSESDIASGLMEGRHLLSAKRLGVATESEAIRRAGIPGIRYRDAGSRGKDGTGTRNFVVFPGEEKKVKILKRD